MRKARILIADDHELFRQAIATMLSQETDMEVVGQAGDGLEALEIAQELHPDLVLMDVNMPICDGIEATRLLRKQLPDVIILMLTVHKNDQKLIECLKSGANGYCLKETTSVGLLRGLRAALNGEATLPRVLLPRLVDEYYRLANLPDVLVNQVVQPVLTTRELKILELAENGATNKEIAAQLSISVYTVKSHIRSILEKLGVENRWEAVTKARKLDLLRPKR